MKLKEGTWKCPYKKEEAEAILCCMKNPITPAEARSIAGCFYGDDKFFDSLDNRESKDPTSDARPDIKRAMINLVSHIDKYPDDFTDYDTTLNKSIKITWDPEVVDILRKICNYDSSEKEETDKKEDLAKAIYDVISKYNLYDFYDILEVLSMEDYEKIDDALLNADLDFLLGLAEEIISDYIDFENDKKYLDPIILNDYDKIKKAYNAFWDIS